MRVQTYEPAKTAVSAYPYLNPSSVKEAAAAPIDELAAVLEISGEEENVFEKPTAAQNKDPFDLKKALEDAKKTGTEAAQQNKNDLEDNSGALTRRLVTALSQEEVLSVISEAFKNLGAVRMAAATGEGKEAKKAFAIIKRLNKLIARAQRKMKDLGEEAAMLLKHQRAEKKKQELLAKQIRAELERHIRERKNREKTYLRDTAPLREEDYMTPGLEPMSRAELEAKVMALAQSMAQIYSPAAAGVPAVAGGEAAAADGAAVSDSGGGDASAPAEGGGGGEVAAE